MWLADGVHWDDLCRQTNMKLAVWPRHIRHDLQTILCSDDNPWSKVRVGARTDPHTGSSLSGGCCLTLTGERSKKLASKLHIV